MKVTVASGFEESALDAASSVSLITRSDWERRGVKRNTKILDMLPGVATYSTWGGADAIAIRGYATELSVRGVATLIDGVPVNTFSYGSGQYDKANLGLGTLNRIEVIRGPGSTLYGSDAFHGVLSYNTYRSDHDELSFSSEVDSSDYARVDGQLSQTSGLHRLNLAMDVRAQGSQDLSYDYTVPGTSLKQTSGRALSYDNYSFSGNYQYGDEDEWLFDAGLYLYDYDASGMVGSGTHFFSGNTFQLDKETSDGSATFQMYRAELSKRFGYGVDVAVKTSFWKNRQQWRFDNSRFDAFCAPGFSDPGAECLLGLPGHIAIQNTEEKHYQSELEFKQKNEALNTQWVVSLGRRLSKIGNASIERASTSAVWEGTYSEPAYSGKQRDINHLLFQARTSFREGKYNFVYGARFDDYSDVGSHISPRLGFIYRQNNHWSHKALYGNAFRAPMALELFGVATVVGNKSLEPEEIDTYELVTQYLKGAWQAEVVLFHSSWDEAITLSGDPALPPGFAIYRNTGKNESKGLEVSANYITDTWVVQSSASYVESENKNKNIDYVAFPKVIANLGVGYHWHDYGFTAFLNQRLQFQQYESDYLSVGGELQRPERVKDYWRTDLHLAHQYSAHLKLFMNFQNVFGRHNVKPSVYNSENGIADDEFALALGSTVTF
ncbi:TonB-dependent receptor [Litoribacillus peritrichatus]|uniref:TonB-dependent receptor n=1 Tax=Litoribacillus peritrichatus TaxID=718191 RepID=A0ABP7M8M6_9GAMM